MKQNMIYMACTKSFIIKLEIFQIYLSEFQHQVCAEEMNFNEIRRFIKYYCYY